MHIFPLKITLRLTRSTRVGHHPAATICSLIKGAASLGGKENGFPPRAILDAVEVGRTSLRPGEEYAFGLTLWDSAPQDCLIRWTSLLKAIRQIGHGGQGNGRSRGIGGSADSGANRRAARNGDHLPGSRGSVGLGGNFVVAGVQSLVDPSSETPLPIPDEWIERQVTAARNARFLTLRWLSPLCASLPRRFGRSPGAKTGKRAGFFDTRRFPVTDLAGRLVRRLREEVGFDLPEINVDPADLVLLKPPGLDRLHWIKWLYGPVHRVEALFGVMGRIVLQVRRPELIRPLVLGQYTAVGEKTSFGLGRYIVEETQAALPPGVPRFLRAGRSARLVELAMDSSVIEREANRLGVPIEEVRPLAKCIIRGEFQAQAVRRFLLPGPKPRLMSVPGRGERVVQRAVHDLLAPVLDQFLSDSCQAYRRGLGRKTAADRIRTAFRQGWKWALKADFHRFFDSVDHALLRDRLEVYVQDDETVELLMQWVAAGAPQPGRGLPTGAVISPLLANLFLEGFDRQVHDDGGFLVRYADDFVLLFRDPSKGREVLARASNLAEQLKLRLNNEKTRLVDLDKTPFDFLGFRFFTEKGWQFRGGGLVQIEDLGWHEAPRGHETGTPAKLPGEQGIESSRSGIWIVGPQIDWIGIEGGDIVCRSRTLGTEDRFQRRRVAELIALGAPTLDHSLFRERGDSSLGLLLADDAGRWTCALTDEPPFELSALVRAQVALSADPARRLTIARQMIAAKLINHAATAECYPARKRSGKLAQKLRGLAEQARTAQSEPQLLGIEGAGGAAWYAEFGARIDRRFQFNQREHPHASDPVNVMLNLAQTVLHRVICLTLIREGFAPSIGFFHVPGAGHAALASDIQEAFRHLMDRVVIEATRAIAPGEFHLTANTTFPLRMESGAYRSLVSAVFRALSTQCVAAGQESARSYRRQIVSLCRSLHRHLLNPEAPLKVFEHR